MWIFKYLTCLMYSHSFIDMTWEHSSYEYCLRCGKVNVRNAVKELILIEGMVRKPNKLHYNGAANCDQWGVSSE